MRGLRFLLLGAAAALLFTVTAPKASAQVTVAVGVEPGCPYGYYDAAPYGCAPAGYYGPEWFTGGVFIGAGPWFHGSDDFRGHVNNVTIRSTATRAHRQRSARKPMSQSVWIVRTSKETKSAMVAAT